MEAGWVKAVEAVEALHFGTPVRLPSAIVLNDGAISQLPPDVAVEVPVTVDAFGIHRHIMPKLPDGVIGLMTKNPAAIFGVYPRKGTLLPGSDADVVVIDMNLEKEVRAEECGSRSDFSLYEGKRLTGWPVLTVKGGEITVENGRCVAAGPGGRYLYRGQTE